MRAMAPTTSTRELLNQFAAATNAHDVAGMMALMTEDCIFENTFPAPDGERFEGQAAVRAFWEELFSSTPSAYFANEETIIQGSRCTVRWRFEWTNADGTTGHVRGIDLFRVRGGKVAEKLAYVKG